MSSVAPLDLDWLDAPVPPRDPIAVAMEAFLAEAEKFVAASAPPVALLTPQGDPPPLAANDIAAMTASLLDFVPRVSPRYKRPTHLEKLASVLARAAAGEPVRALVSVPPRHGKTEVVLHGIAWILEKFPEHMLAYVSYAAELARSKSRNARDYAKIAGVELREDANALHEWITPDGGGLRAAGIGGPLTGQGFQILVIDDPTKNRQEAESALIRERNYSWFTSTAMTRLTPTGAAIVVHTRWHEDDLIGRLEKESKKYEESGGAEGEYWEVINLQAIDEESGEALWPERWPVPVLMKRRRTVGEYDWASLFQGRPRPKGGKLFREPVRYDIAQIAGRRIYLAVDVAGTKKTRANWTVAVAMAFEGYGDQMTADLLEVMRLQEEIPEVCRKLEAFQGRWSGAPLIVEASGLGKAVPQTLRDTNPRLRLVEVYPQTDKYARSQSYAAGWNSGRVRLAQSGNDLAEFIRVTTGFTGVNDAEDDDVDAGAHCWNHALGNAPPEYWSLKGGTSRYAVQPGRSSGSGRGRR